MLNYYDLFTKKIEIIHKLSYSLIFFHHFGFVCRFLLQLVFIVVSNNVIEKYFKLKTYCFLVKFNSSTVQKKRLFWHWCLCHISDLKQGQLQIWMEHSQVEHSTLILENLKPVEKSKNPFIIIWTSSKFVLIFKIRRVRLKN